MLINKELASCMAIMYFKFNHLISIFITLKCIFVTSYSYKIKILIALLFSLFIASYINLYACSAVILSHASR